VRAAAAGSELEEQEEAVEQGVTVVGVVEAVSALLAIGIIAFPVSSMDWIWAGGWPIWVELYGWVRRWMRKGKKGFEI
jgi:hypothetical protein